MDIPRNRQAERRRMSGGGGVDERRQRRRGAVHFNISRCAFLTLGKPRARRATLTKFNIVSRPKACGDERQRGAAGARSKPPRGQRRQPLGERRGARSA